MKIFPSVWQNLMTAGLLALVLAGCGGKVIDVNVTIVDQKTALENQILGSYEELGNDVLLLASVRSVDEEGKLKNPPPKFQKANCEPSGPCNARDSTVMIFKGSNKPSAPARAMIAS